jgi:multidrug efflux pump
MSEAPLPGGAPPSADAPGRVYPTDLFIERPVLALVLSLLILLLGAMGFSELAVRETPDVQNPVVTVSTAWPGADPAIVESDLTEVLERELNGIEGVRTLTSSSQEGSSTITVEFNLDRDLEAAANDVRSRVSRVRKKLPDDIDEPTVEKADASAQPVMFLRLAGEGQSLLDITEIADTVVRDRLENVEGVSGVDLFGAQVYAMRVELDPVRLAARKVTVGDVEAALRQGNIDLPAGRIEGAATQLTLHVEGGLSTPEAFGGLVLRAGGGEGGGGGAGAGETRVYLRDVANIRIGAENERSAARADALPSISLAITPQAKANIVAVSDEVKRRLPGIQEDLPAGVTLDNVYDRADAVRTSIHDVELTLVVAFLLVVVVIFAFLRDLRSTLVPAVAIPVSIVGTFFVMWAIGFTVNVFTLFGLVLAIGLVVDDAIVVLENVVRRVETGEPVRIAALLGTRQIAMAVIATTLSLVLVFLPVIFTGGTTGRLFLEFGATVAASVAISMIVALTLTPLLCSRLLVARPQHAAHAEPDRLARAFDRSLGALMRRPWLVVPVLMVVMAGVYAGFRWTPREFFPTEDRNMFIIRTVAQEGTSFPWMDARMREVEQSLMPLVPERRMMLSRVATGPGGVSAGTNTGMIMFPLLPRDERGRSQQEIVAALKGPLSTITAFRTIPIQFPTVGRGFSSPLQFVLQHPDFDALTAELPRFVAAMRAIPGLSAVNEDLKLDRPELNLRIDREAAARLGLPIREVARTLQILTSGLDLSTFKRGVRQHKVIVGLPLELRSSPADLDRIHLRGRDGRLYAMSNLIERETRAGPASRYHYNRVPSATVSANPDGIPLGEAIARVQAMAEAELPPGFRTALAGESRDFAESASSLAQMFLLALALVYLLLAAQFDSFAAPISIMLAVPLALAGAFLGLTVFGMTLSFFGQVGLILLVGLVTKNGILIVEYARQLEAEHGQDPWTAAREAARLRFRPILMTSVATIGGAIPIALGLSGTSRASLGVAVVGGMVSATVMTLYITPVVYAALSRRRPRAPAVLVGLLGLSLPLLAPAAAEAAPLTLGEVLSAADAGNVDLQAGALALVPSEAAVTAARAELLPSLSATGGLLWGTLSAPTGRSSLGLRAEVPLLAPGGLAGLEAAAARLDLEEAKVSLDQRRVRVAAGAAFISLQQTEESARAAETRRGRAEALLTLARHRAELGLAPALDATRAELALRVEEQRLLAARTARSEASLRLSRLLGLPPGGALSAVAPAAFADPDSLPAEDTVAELLGPVSASHPLIAGAAATARAAEAGAKAADRALLPSLSAWGSAGIAADLSGGGAFPVEEVGLGASLPLWVGGARSAARGAAGAQVSIAHLRERDARQALDAALRLSLRRAHDAAAALPIAEAALALSREELSRAEGRYRDGAGDNLAVINAQTSLALAEQFKVDSLAIYNLALLEWYSAAGGLEGLLDR